MRDGDNLNLDFDLHIHTFHSPCGEKGMRPAAILRAAADRGITRIGITDHLYPFSDPGMFDDVRSAIAELRPGTNAAPQVFLGCEAEIMAPGRTIGSPELAERLDFVMVAATHFQNAGLTELPPTKDERALAEYYLRMFEYAVSLPWADTLAHPFLVVPDACSPRILDHIFDSDVLPLLELARENDVAMEISPRALFPWQAKFSLHLYELCKKVGLKFSLGSDAHSLERVGEVQVLRPLITRLGLTMKDFWLPQSKTR